MSGQRKFVSYPLCGDWSCSDEEDWDVASSDDPEYRGAKREERIVRYHEPRAKWSERLQEERDKRNGGHPLWSTR